jgi:hypothetical protein
MATRPNAPTSMSPSTRYCRSPSYRTGVGGPKREPLRTCDTRVSVDLEARVEDEDEVGGEEADDADDAGDAEEAGDADEGGEEEEGEYEEAGESGSEGANGASTDLRRTTSGEVSERRNWMYMWLRNTRKHRGATNSTRVLRVWTRTCATSEGQQAQRANATRWIRGKIIKRWSVSGKV